MLIHKASSIVLLGAGYTATVEMVLNFMEREQRQGAILETMPVASDEKRPLPIA
jgi:hypothetical protein